MSNYDSMDVEPTQYRSFPSYGHSSSAYNFIQESPQLDASLIAQVADNYVAPIKRPLKQFTRKRKPGSSGSGSAPSSPAPMTYAMPSSPVHHHQQQQQLLVLQQQQQQAIVVDQPLSSGKKQWHRPDPAVESDEARFCKACGITTTPQWRRGPDGERSLCNACGLHFYKIVQREKTVEKERKRQVGTKLPIEMLLNDPDF